jgi:hypothetical protein
MRLRAQVEHQADVIRTMDGAPDPAEAMRARCEDAARGELWFPERNNSRYRCEVGNGKNQDAGQWNMEGDYGKARNAAADAIAALKGNGEGE